jgi:hypothetical protein
MAHLTSAEKKAGFRLVDGVKYAPVQASKAKEMSEMEKWIAACPITLKHSHKAEGTFADNYKAGGFKDAHIVGIYTNRK